jgi:hypothetical protein
VVDEVEDGVVVVLALVVPPVVVEECDEPEVVELEWGLVVELLSDEPPALSPLQPCVATPRRATKNRRFMVGAPSQCPERDRIWRTLQRPGLHAPHLPRRKNPSKPLPMSRSSI